jgi:beta-glucanase (GH16 family)
VTVSGDFHPEDFSHLVFSDEFDGSTLDRSLWCTRYQYGGGPALQIPDADCTGPRHDEGTGDFLANNSEQQRYVDWNTQGETMHVVSDGTLKLRATKTRKDDEYKWAYWESALIRSKLLFKPSSLASYYITARVRLPPVKGVWTAFWLMPAWGTNGQIEWPPEIDIMDAPLNGVEDTEFMLHQSLVVREGAQQSVSRKREIIYHAPEYETTWGNYIADHSLRGIWLEVAALWTPSGTCFYIDGQQTVCDNYVWVTDSGGDAGAAPVVLNLAVGGPWAGRHGIDESGFPTQMEIDHVRVYSNF